MAHLNDACSFGNEPKRDSAQIMRDRNCAGSCPGKTWAQRWVPPPLYKRPFGHHMCQPQADQGQGVAKAEEEPERDLPAQSQGVAGRAGPALRQDAQRCCCIGACGSGSGCKLCVDSTSQQDEKTALRCPLTHCSRAAVRISRAPPAVGVGDSMARSWATPASWRSCALPSSLQVEGQMVPTLMRTASSVAARWTEAKSCAQGGAGEVWGRRQAYCCDNSLTFLARQQGRLAI